MSFAILIITFAWNLLPMATVEIWKEYYAGIRIGLGQPAVLLLGEFLQPIQRLIIFKELYQKGLRIKAMVAQAVAWNKEFPLERIFIAEKNKEFSPQFAAQDLPIWPIAYDEKSPDYAVNLASEQLGRFLPIPEEFKLSPQDKGAALVVRAACEMTAAEFRAYRTKAADPERPTPDKPLQIHHYTMDAVHLMVLGLFSSPDYRCRWI